MRRWFGERGWEAPDTWALVLALIVMGVLILMEAPQ